MMYSPFSCACAKPALPSKPIPARSPLPARLLARAEAAAADYARDSRATSTWRAYESDWRIFRAWCASVACAALPAEPSTVAIFLASEAKRGIAPSTLSRRLAAIRLMHVGAKVASPHDAIEVEEVLRGVRRRTKRPVNRKAPAVDEDIKRLVDARSNPKRSKVCVTAPASYSGSPAPCAARNSSPSIPIT